MVIIFLYFITVAVPMEYEKSIQHNHIVEIEEKNLFYKRTNKKTVHKLDVY